MLSKSQFDLILSLLNSIINTSDLDSYLKDAVDLLNTEFKPRSIAVYMPIESEDKLVLIKKLGEDFDHQINSIPNFSLTVRKAIKKKSVLFAPGIIDESDPHSGFIIILMPLIGGDRHAGLIGMVFADAETVKHRANINYYQFLSRVIGFGGLLKKNFAEHQRREDNTHNENYSDKIKSMGVLSSGVSHEFNNIFAVIKGYAELIFMNTDMSPDIQNAAKKIDEQTERAEKLIDSLQVFYSERNVKLSYHALNDIVTDVVSIHETAIKNGNINLRLVLGSNPRVLVDRERIREAVFNLFQNSIHSIDPQIGGEMVVSTRSLDSEVVLSIRDDGRTMTREIADTVIHPFSETTGRLREYSDEESRGVVLRLAIAHGIMSNHGGKMEIDCGKGPGKEIRLFFNRIEPGADRETRYDAGDVLFIGDTKILIVDDEEPIREILTRAFDYMGYQVVAVANGEDAVEICSFEDIDIVFLDYLMPGPKGDMVFDSIKRVCPGTDIIIITGVEDIPNIGKLLNGGLVSILKKPFKIEKIIRLTNDLIYKRINQKR